MPVVPSVQGNRPQTRPVAIAPSRAFIQPVKRNDVPNLVQGASIGAQAVRNLGSTVNNIVDDVAHTQYKRAVQTMLIGEQTALDNFSLDLQNEYLSRKGRNAFGSPDEFSNKYDEYVKERIDQIPDNQAKNLFSKVAAGRRSRAVRSVYTHERRQMDEFTNATIDASIEASKRRATEYYNDPTVMQNSIQAARDSILAKSRMNGLPDQAVQNELQQLERDIKFTVAQKVLLEDPESFDPQNFVGIPAEDLLNLQTQAFKLQDRIETERQETTAADLYAKYQDGNLQLADVEGSRAILDYKDYIDLRRIAITANPITNGTVYANLLAKTHRGEDITDDLEVARFTDQTLSNEDWKGLADINKKNDTGIKDPVTNGRRFVLDSVGASAKELEIGGSRTLAKARFDYDIEIDNFVKKNGRQPTIVEVKSIADSIVDTYDGLDIDDVSTTLAKPTFMTKQERVTFKPNDVERSLQLLERVRRQTYEEYLKRHNGDERAVARDPGYKNQKHAIDTWENLVQRAIGRNKKRNNTNRTR